MFEMNLRDNIEFGPTYTVKFSLVKSNKCDLISTRKDTSKNALN